MKRNTLWFVSYCGHDGKWIGAAVIRGTRLQAEQSGDEFGVLPCAERMVLAIPEGAEVDEKWFGKLLDKADIREMSNSELYSVKCRNGEILSVDDA